MVLTVDPFKVKVKGFRLIPCFSPKSSRSKNKDQGKQNKQRLSRSAKKATVFPPHSLQMSRMTARIVLYMLYMELVSENYRGNVRKMTGN